MYCQVEGCEGRHYARGWCSKHYQRWRLHGDPLYIGSVVQGDRRLAFFNKVEQSDCCWLWKGGKNQYGYGLFWNGSRQMYVHRFSYEIHHGPIPPGMVVNHLCLTKSCVRPDHLELLSQGDNSRHWHALAREALRGYQP